MCQDSSYHYRPGLTLQPWGDRGNLTPGKSEASPHRTPHPQSISDPAVWGFLVFIRWLHTRTFLTSLTVSNGSLSKAEREYWLKKMERKIANSWLQSRHFLEKIKVKLSSLGQLLVKLVSFKKIGVGTSLVVQWLRVCFPMLWVQVQSLVGKLRFHTPGDQKAKI